MTSPIVEINGDGLFLNLDRGTLIISKGKDVLGTLPFDGISALLLTTPSASITQQVLIRCAENNIPIIVCGKNYLPIGLFLPCFQHSETKSRLETQLQATEPLKKRIWKKIIQEKINNQKLMLKFFGMDHDEFTGFIERVRSGDPDNVEAVAARRYWKKMFGDDFVRSNDNDIINSLLNYGYAVLRAGVARWCVAHGLNPSLSVYHQNYKNSLVLVDDLMEPFRPYVDYIVKEIINENKLITELTPDLKKKLVRILELPVKVQNDSTILNNSLSTFVYSYCHSLTMATVEVEFPSMTVAK